jgi:hypothetical protein
MYVTAVTVTNGWQDLWYETWHLLCLQDIIERNIKRASDKSQADYQEITYEAYGPGECLGQYMAGTYMPARQPQLPSSHAQVALGLLSRL